MGVLPVLHAMGTAWGQEILLETPPAAPVRLVAEFEPMQGVAVVGLSRNIVDFYRYVAEDLHLILFWESQETYDRMLQVFPESGVNMDNCEFRQGSVIVPRDELPWFMFVNHTQPAFVYNYFEGLPEYGLGQGYPVYRSGLEIIGGDFMTDGQGTGVILDNTLVWHPEMAEAFAERALDYWGVRTCHSIDNYRFGADGYLHIDCMAKFLSPDTIMVARVPESDPRWKLTEEAAAYFCRQVSCYKTPYRVVRVDTPDEEPYTNSLILNDRVFVPIADERPEANANALASYEAAMPGYEVIGISKSFVTSGKREDFEDSWLSSWALHCDTMSLPDAEMLYIEHTPMLDRPPQAEGFPVRARIVAHSHQPFVNETPTVIWKLADQNDWNSTVMAPRPEPNDHRFQAMIPPQPVRAVIQYYLHAEDASGRSENHPYIGAPQAHTFTVTRFGADASALSAARGGTVSFFMNAGPDNAGLGYALNYTLDVNEPNGLPELPAQTLLSAFAGTLDEAGTGSAILTLPPGLPVAWIEGAIHFDFILTDDPQAVLERVSILILE